MKVNRAFKSCYKVEGYDLLDQNSSRKIKDELEHSFIYILHDLQFFQMWRRLYNFVNKIPII